MEHEKPLKTKQLQAVRLLVGGETIGGTAKVLGVSEMTLYRWQKKEAFAAQMRLLNCSGMAAVATLLNKSAYTATETAQEIMSDGRYPAELRLQAAQIVLRAVPAVSAALEKGMKHRVADFDINNRFEAAVNTFDGAGNLLDRGCSNAGSGVMTASGGVAI